jgi:hypothetical protein
MKLEWYNFEESYLIGIDYKISECIIELLIDARITIDNPKAVISNIYEDFFEEIKIVLKGVQHLNIINSLNLSDKNKEDLGNIDKLELRNYSKLKDDVNIDINKNTLKLSIEESEEVFAEVFSQINKIYFIEFISEMVAFKAAINEIELIE